MTHRHVHVDRIASAWLIRRFIDPEASFKFVEGKGYVPEPDELRFDMADAEFTHEGDRCSFETLVFLTGLETDPALRSEEHTSELQSLMRISYAVFCLKKKKQQR